MAEQDDERPPFGIRAVRIGDRLIITRRWCSLFRMMAGPFGAAALWLGALGLGSPAPATRLVSPAVVLLIAGGLAAYVFLTSIINRTRIVVDPHFLQITAGLAQDTSHLEIHIFPTPAGLLNHPCRHLISERCPKGDDGATGAHMRRNFVPHVGFAIVEKNQDGRRRNLR